MFEHWIASPITEKRPRSMERFRDLVRATCLRRTKEFLKLSVGLLEPMEKIKHVKLDHDDQEIYDFFRNKTASIAENMRRGSEGGTNLQSSKNGNVLSLMNFLRLICNHGKDILPPSALLLWAAQDARTADWDVTLAAQKACSRCGEILEEPGIVSTCMACSAPTGSNEIENVSFQSEHVTVARQTHRSKAANSKMTATQPSAKVASLLNSLHAEQIQEPGARPTKRCVLSRLLRGPFTFLTVFSVVFSIWTKMLDVLEPQLQKQGFKFQRIDGQMSIRSRSEALRQFNEIPDCTVMLASIGSCGEGYLRFHCPLVN
jgi:SNF2 family DNA or RNA helicase